MKYLLRFISLIPAMITIGVFYVLGLPYGNELNIPLPRLFYDAIFNDNLDY